MSNCFGIDYINRFDKLSLRIFWHGISYFYKLS